MEANREVIIVPVKAGEILTLRGVTCRIMEDGSNTDNRVGCAEFTLPPHTTGPPPHWHEMHDETFLVTAGTVRFHQKGGRHTDAKAGDFVTVPTQAPHSFSNPFDTEAKFFNTFTPAHYIQYFKLMAKWAAEGEVMDAAKIKQAMAYFATIGVEGSL